jgi:predicted transcriptional regulator of viral defense system
MEYKRVTIMTPGIGPLETQAIAYCQSRKMPQVEAGDLVRDLKWTPQQERKVLSQLARKGFITRIRRGLYLAPKRLAIGGRWTPGEMLTLATLMDDCGGTYQISGPNAFQRYGWTEQIPNRVYAYNNRISGDRQIGPVSLSLIEVADDRLGSTEMVRTPDGLDIVYATRARALVDAVYDWSRFDTLPRAYGWIAREVEKDDGFAAELTEVTIRYGNQGTLRRIGATLEQLAVQEGLLRRLDRSLRKSSSFIPMAPTKSKRGRPGEGKTSKRWGAVFNDE